MASLSQHEQLLSRDHEIEHLKLLIAKLRRMQFGRKSEKLDRQIEQLELKLEDLEVSASGPCRTRLGSGRAETRSHRELAVRLPDHLPRETKTHAPRNQPAPIATAR